MLLWFLFCLFGINASAVPGRYAGYAVTKGKGLSFRPANSPTGITCEYPEYHHAEACNSGDDRSCWIKNHADNTRWDIHTDYEAEGVAPKGILREYFLEVTESPLSPDGYVKPLGLVINGGYPAPVIEACWGDELLIHVTNKLSRNGTTIHYHGIRQLYSTQMDGVNAVTQCAIAQNSTFDYRWNVTQYGNTWYHSHYSLQYADGLAGPILLHGPSSANWDIAWDQILISDWVHRSAFQDFQTTLNLGIPVAQSLLVNGSGHYQCSGTLPNSTEPDPNCCSAASDPSPDCCDGDPGDARCRNFGTYFEGVFTRGAMFIFSIDGHKLRVISADLVPIQPYETDSIFIGIGQRYEVIVDGDPEYETPDGNYWMRTQIADLCGLVEQNSSATGIIRYNSSSTAIPHTYSQTNRTTCKEEPLDMLVPVVPWQIDAKAVNAAELGLSEFQAGLSTPLSTNITHGYIRWSLDKKPFWLDFDNPTMLGLDNEIYKPEQAVVPYSYSHGFIYLIATSQQLNQYTEWKHFEKHSQLAPHPMHLHGHDFVILAQLNGTEYNVTSGMPPLKLDNPPRRDTTMLDSDGYLVIAFKPDNPGVWLFHCHIAWHVSSGLGFQIIERGSSILDTISSIEPVEQSCKEWKEWALWYDQNDSGV